MFLEKNSIGELDLPDSRSYHKTTVIKQCDNWHKDRQIDQRKRTESRNRPTII